MKAVLDHVGIAVKDLSAALAFYRDALGLHVEVPEDVAAQRVRAHFIPAGEASLELLEATASDSAIAKYVEKRGPGLHHITLRVEDIRAALDQLKVKGVRLVDEEPRPGAEGALVAFIHPSSAHGVLVELKQASHEARATSHEPVRRYRVGDLELISLFDGYIRLDGGAMFGVVPRTLWEKHTPPDERGRILLAMRPLVVRGVRTMLIDAASRRSLEITRTLRDGVRSGSLLDVIDRTVTSGGARRLSSWLNQPLTDVAAIRLRHAAVAEWKSKGGDRLRDQIWLDSNECMKVRSL